MNSKSTFLTPPIALLTMLAAAVSFTSGQDVAVPPPSKLSTSWQELGFRLPDGYPTDMIPLFEALNESRGTWSFAGETIDGEAATPLAGSLNIIGNPASGMVPFWRINCSWPADDPRHGIDYMIMAEPRKSGFDLMLTRFGPVKLPLVDKAKPRIMPDMFRGEWNSKNRTISWTARDMPARLRGKATEKNSSEPKQTFEMVVAVDGKILIQNSKHTPQGQMATGKAIVRTAEAVAGPVTLTGEHSFQTADEVADSRIKPWLPPQATEITLLSERNGHYARYKVAEKDFMKFLDDIWEADKGKSAHKRGERSGGGTVAKPERIENRFKRAGWENQGKFTIHHGPSKRSSAVTTYYYDREAGIAYQDRGYW